MRGMSICQLNMSSLCVSLEDRAVFECNGTLRMNVMSPRLLRRVQGGSPSGSSHSLSLLESKRHMRRIETSAVGSL